MAIAISGGVFYCCRSGINYFSPLNSKAFLQWRPLFDKIRLLGTRLEVEEVPPGWVPIPQEYDVRELVVFGHGQYKRRKMIMEGAREHLKGISLLYGRGPNHEAYYTFCIAKKMRIPLLLEMHGDCESAVLAEESDRLIRVATKRLRAEMVRRAQMRMAREAIAVISVGPEMISKYVPKGTPVLISTNHTINEEEFVKRQSYKLHDPPRLLFVGEMAYYKGIRFLFSALKMLKKQGRSFEMILVGSGHLRNWLEDYAHQHGLEGSVKFAGQVAFSDIMSYYRNSDLFILPSVGGEGVPRVIQEAASCGCPVLATDVGSIRWQLDHGAGIVVPPGDENALAENITRILNDESLRRSIGEAGYRRGLEYTFEKQASRIADFVKANIPDKLRRA